MTDAQPRGSHADPSSSDRPAALVFAVAVAVAFPALLWFGREQWFFLDEWIWVSGRDTSSINGLLDDQNGHWVTTPYLAFRFLYQFFGIRTYLPYQILTVASHLVVVVLQRIVMRRVGVGAWTATAVSCTILLLGSGSQNIIFAFQVAWNGPIICGLGAMLLSDHDGGLNRRDAAALALVVLGLTASAIMVPMVIGLGVMTLFRRGARVAAFFTIPPGAIFVIWYLVFVSEVAPTGVAASPAFDLALAPSFFAEMNVAVFQGLGGHSVTAAILASLSCIGLFTAWTTHRDRGECTPMIYTFALASAWLSFAAITTFNRSATIVAFPFAASASRYIHVGIVLLIPVLALGLQALLRANVSFAVVPVAALLVGVPTNVEHLAEPNPFALGRPDLIAAMATSPYLDQGPGDRSINPPGIIPEFGPTTVAWIRQAVEGGEIDLDTEISAGVRLDADLLLAAEHFSSYGLTAPTCGLHPPQRATLQAGDWISFDGTIILTVVGPSASSNPRQFASSGGDVIKFVAGPVDIAISSAGETPADVCINSR